MKFRRYILVFILLFLVSSIFFINYMTSVPGISYNGIAPAADKILKSNLEKHINVLAKEIGKRNFQNLVNLNKSKEYIISELKNIGLSAVELKFRTNNQDFYNIEAVIPGESDNVLVIGAHYDSAYDSPGANDNASGVAALIEIAKFLVKNKPKYTVRIAAFTNEEPPFFFGKGMGSEQYAGILKAQGIKNLKMFSLETMGYYSNLPGSQKYPFPFNMVYPDQGNFIAFVSNLSSRELLHYSINSFREKGKFPSEGVASPEIVPGIGWSDHSSFWNNGYQAIMVTDTAPFRYPYYHTFQDTPDKIDSDKLSILTDSLARFFQEFEFES